MSVLSDLENARSSAGSNAKLIQTLEQAILALKGQEAKKESFAVIKQRRIAEREARLAKFGDGFRQMKYEKMHQELVQAGWAQGMRNEKTEEYQYGNGKGVLIKIAGGKFMVVHGPATLKEKTSLEGLASFLSENKKKS